MSEPIYPKADFPVSSRTLRTANERAERWKQRAMEARSELDAMSKALASDDLLDAVIAGTCAVDLRKSPPHPTCVLAANAAIRALKANIGGPDD